MMKHLPILLIILSLTSCYTSKKATKDIVKAQTSYPSVVAKACLSYYPTKDSIAYVEKFLPGKTDTVENYIDVECPPSLLDTVKVPYIVRAKCPPSIIRVDTVVNETFNYYEDTRKITVFIDSLVVLKEKNTKLEVERKLYKQRSFNYLRILIITALAIILYILFKMQTYDNIKTMLR